MPSATDAKQIEPGANIILLVGSLDPPTMDHFRALEALSVYDGADSVWLCPLSNQENTMHVRAMCSIVCSDIAGTGKQVTLCTAALDKKMGSGQELAAWVRKRYPDYKFRVATVSPEKCADECKTFEVVLGQATPSSDADQVVLDKFLPAPKDLLTRIKNGSDESRNFQAPVWAYIQKHKLYRS